ncbi:MAG: hypothetical protein IK099_10365 [Clostridia bacterium]|nr:hypothetical protein [Clostridia bacterium]
MTERAPWARETLCPLGLGLELSFATVDHRAAALNLGRWSESHNHIKWSGWLKPWQLRRLYRYLGDHPELMEGTEPPEPEPPDELHPFS